MTTDRSWRQRIGNQRDWVWRGWQIRYAYIRSSQPQSITPLIFLHGFGACIEHWRNNLSVLSQQHPVYALDLLGFGASRKTDTEYSAYLWVEQVYDFWRTFIGQPVVLVGNSLGSLVALSAVTLHPEMVRGIVMLNLPDVSLTQKNVPKLAKALENSLASPLILKTIFKIVSRMPIIRRGLQLAYENKTAIDDELMEIIAAPAQDRGAAETFAALFKSVRKPGYAPSTETILTNLSIPTMLIWGKCDRVISSSFAPIFAQMNPQIELVELEQVGHCPHDEVPEVFNQILANWLKRQFLDAKNIYHQ